MRLFSSLLLSVLAVAAVFSTVSLRSVSVQAACEGDTSISGASSGVPLGGGTPSQDAVPFFWTFAFQTGKMDQGAANGGLGGLLGADYFCNRVASSNPALLAVFNSTSLIQSRQGLYKAVISNRLTDAIHRFDNMSGDALEPVDGATIHDVMDSNGKCIASGIDDLFNTYNLDYSFPDNRGILQNSSNGVVDFWTASTTSGTKYHDPNAGLTDLQINNLYCSASSSATDQGWTSQSGSLSAGVGSINDPAYNISSYWLATGVTKGCVSGLHLLCLQGLPTPTQGNVNGDPQFTGLQGQQFQVHGMPDEYFNLVSSPDMQLNSRFAYLASGRCNYNNTECWSHPGTYVDQLGFMFPGLTIKAIAGTHQDGMTVYVNEKRLMTNNMGSTHHTIHSATHQHHQDINSTQIITITYTQHDQLVVASPLFTITATNSDMFFNFGVSLHSPSLLSAGSVLHHLTDKSAASASAVVYPSFPLHGLLGQTWKNARYQHGRMFAGTVDDYMLLDSKLMSNKFIYNQYKH